MLLCLLLSDFNFHCVELSACNMSKMQPWDGEHILHLLVGDAYLGHDLTWKMAQVISPCLTHEAQCAQGRGSVRLMGLHCTYVNIETCEAANQGWHSVQSALTLRVCSSSLPGHVPATQLKVKERDTVDGPLYTFPPCSLFKTSGQCINLLHTCSCPFIYSSLINVKNQFGPADTLPASLIRSWIWNHSDLIGSFYSDVSSEASENLSWPQWASLSRWEHFILLASLCSGPTQ